MARSATTDALEKFRFGVSWGETGTPNTDTLFNNTDDLKTNLSRAGFHDVQMPKRSTNKITYRDGTDPDIYSISAGLSTMEDIVLSRGLFASLNAKKDFHSWMRLVHDANISKGNFGGGARPPTGSQDYRREVVIWMYDREGHIVRAWRLYNCWPVNFVPGSDLNASEDGEKSLEQITLTYEDFFEVQISTPITTVPDSQEAAKNG